MIDVLIADDHPVVLQGLRQIVAETSDIVIKGEATTGDEVVDQVRSGQWDVVVLDLTMPGTHGMELLKRLKAEHPKLRVLVLSMHPEDDYAVRLLRAGASGYLNKRSAGDRLVEAIRKVAQGGKYVSQTLAEKIAFELDVDSDKPPHEKLSDREFQVFSFIASGRTVTEIAEELSLSVKTVSTYRSRVLEKMNMRRNAELTRYALENGLVR
jgi:DNA-binding NarL/FixJ family response regulator